MTMSKCACEHDGNKLTNVCGLHMQFARNYAADEIERLTTELENERAKGIHSCHPGCQRPMCVLQRENAKLQAVVDALRICEKIIAVKNTPALFDLSDALAALEEQKHD